MGKGGSGVLVLGMVVVAACSGASRANRSPAATAPRTSTTAATARRSTPTFPQATGTTVARPAPEYSFDDTVASPRLINTGTDYAAIVQSLERRGDWLGAHHPDPNLTQDTIAPGTRLFAGYLSDLTYLRDHHLRLVLRCSAPTTVAIVSATADAFTARLDVHDMLYQTYDRSGRVATLRRRPAVTTFLDVVVLAHGRWYLAASDAQVPPVVHL